MHKSKFSSSLLCWVHITIIRNISRRDWKSETNRKILKISREIQFYAANVYISFPCRILSLTVCSVCLSSLNSLIITFMCRIQILNGTNGASRLTSECWGKTEIISTLVFILFLFSVDFRFSQSQQNKSHSCYFLPRWHRICSNTKNRSTSLLMAIEANNDGSFSLNFLSFLSSFWTLRKVERASEF